MSSVTLTTTSKCGWTASFDATWATVTSGSTGTGNGTVSFLLAANLSTSARTARLTVADQTVTVTQAAPVTVPPACSYSVSPDTVAVPPSGSTGSVMVTTTAGCQWTAAFDAGWASLTGTANGTGSGAANYTVAANPSSSGRTATLTVAGRTVTFNQAAAPPPCTYSISPASATVGSAATTLTVSVAAGAGCAWSSRANDDWLIVASGDLGSGNGTVKVDVDRQNGTGKRVGTVTVAGQTFTVTQSK
jgi:hypothetical protein